MLGGKDYRIGTLRYNWLMSAHASQAFSMSTVPIRKICCLFCYGVEAISFNACKQPVFVFLMHGLDMLSESTPPDATCIWAPLVTSFWTYHFLVGRAGLSQFAWSSTIAEVHRVTEVNPQRRLQSASTLALIIRPALHSSIGDRFFPVVATLE